MHDRLYELADGDPDAGRGYRYDHDLTNQRVWALLVHGEPFTGLATDPVALELARHLLGPRVLLSNISANITNPGGGEMALHTDQGYIPVPWPEEPLAANAIWVIDEFRRRQRGDHGGTREPPARLWPQQGASGLDYHRSWCRSPPPQAPSA